MGSSSPSHGRAFPGSHGPRRAKAARRPGARAPGDPAEEARPPAVGGRLGGSSSGARRDGIPGRLSRSGRFWAPPSLPPPALEPNSERTQGRAPEERGGTRKRKGSHPQPSSRDRVPAAPGGAEVKRGRLEEEEEEPPPPGRRTSGDRGRRSGRGAEKENRASGVKSIPAGPAGTGSAARGGRAGRTGPDRRAPGTLGPKRPKRRRAPGPSGRMAERGSRRCGGEGAALLAPLLLLSQVAAGSGLRCFQCVGMFHECVHAEQFCAPQDRSCFSSSIRLFYSNNYSGVFMLPDLEIAEYVMKGCSAEDASNRTAEVSSGDDREVHTTFRCDRDLCNARVPGAPASAAQPAPNGMECYSCFDRGTGDCAPGNATRTRCSGDMDQCMDFTVTDGAWKMTYRACALATLCRRQYLLPELPGRLEIRCCSEPLCNDGRPGGLTGSLCSHFAHRGTEREPENGLSCASCCESGRGECGPGNGTAVRCRGEQRACVNVTEGGRTLLRGCSLEKLCRETPRLLGLGREASTRCCSGSFCNAGTGTAGGRSPALLLPVALAFASAPSVLARRVL